MNDLMLPDKISWSIDLSGNWQDNWSKRSLKQVINRLSEWESKVNYEILDARSIKEVFYPHYQRTVMQKSDFRLKPEDVAVIVDNISLNDEYQLLWFKSKIDGAPLGGNVLHIFPEVVKGVYRAFDHQYATQNNMKNLDYFTDYVLQKYVVEMGKFRLNRGLMGHPCHNLGLSLFKLRTGARPKTAKNMPTTLYAREMVSEILDKYGVFAWYDTPDLRGRFERFMIITSRDAEEVRREIGDTLERVGIDLVVQPYSHENTQI